MHIGGGYLRFRKQFLDEFPIKADLRFTEIFIKLCDHQIGIHSSLLEIVNQFTKLLLAKLPTININNKLQSWYSLSPNDFFKELAKQKIKLPLSDQQEWLQYFEQQKAIANNIQQTIQQTDAAIDAMVYGLYGLTEQEIAIVEG